MKYLAKQKVNDFVIRLYKKFYRLINYSCIIGPSAVFVTASENRLTLISRNLKHTSGLTFGSLAFNSIVALDVDVHRNYVFVLRRLFVHYSLKLNYDCAKNIINNST